MARWCWEPSPWSCRTSSSLPPRRQLRRRRARGRSSSNYNQNMPYCVYICSLLLTIYCNTFDVSWLAFWRKRTNICDNFVLCVDWAAGLTKGVYVLIELFDLHKQQEVHLNKFYHCFLYSLFLTRRYGPLRGPTSSSCGGLRPRIFSGKKRAYYAVLALFWQFLVSSSNLGTF